VVGEGPLNGVNLWEGFSVFAASASFCCLTSLDFHVSSSVGATLGGCAHEALPAFFFFLFLGALLAPRRKRCDASHGRCALRERCCH